jgi:hypothetical protein
MKKKTNKNITLIGISLFLLIGFILILYFKTSQAIVQIELQENGYRIEPIQTGTFIFEGIEGTYETVWLGSLTSYGGSGGSTTNDYTIKIDGDNDGERAISNLLDSNSRLTLSSTNQIIGSSNGGTNYIEAKITLPAGTIKVDYDYSVTSYYGDGSRVVFILGKETMSFGTPHFNVVDRGGSVSGSDTFEFELTEPEELTFRVETTTSQKNENVIGNLEVDFTPKPPQTTYFRLADNTCQEIQLNPQDKTENDYLTLEECESQIKKVDLKLIITIISGIVILVFVILILKRRKK